MGDGVGGEDRRERPVEIVVKALQRFRPRPSPSFKGRDIGGAGGKKRRFGDGAEKRHAKSEGEIGDEQKHPLTVAGGPRPVDLCAAGAAVRLAGRTLDTADGLILGTTLVHR